MGFQKSKFIGTQIVYQDDFPTEDINFVRLPPWKEGLIWKNEYHYTSCNRHRVMEVETLSIMMETIAHLNIERTKNNTLVASYVDAYRQIYSCVPPDCVGSVHDLIACGGFAMSVQEWSKIKEYVPVNDQSRGPICGTSKIALYVSFHGCSEHEIRPTNIARCSRSCNDACFISVLLRLIDFARFPVMCSTLAAEHPTLTARDIYAIQKERSIY